MFCMRMLVDQCFGSIIYLHILQMLKPTMVLVVLKSIIIYCCKKLSELKRNEQRNKYFNA